MTQTPHRVGSLGAGDDDRQDPDLAPIRPDEKVTTLQTLEAAMSAALTADVEYEPITLPVLKRPGVSVRFSTELDDETVNMIRSRAKDRKSVDGVNNLRFCSMLVAKQCEGMLWNGEEVTDDSGQPWTFGHAEVRKLYGGAGYQNMRAADCVIKVYGADAHVMLAANEIMDRAGFGDEMVEVDGEGPTTAS